jgi:hypothetical protein
MTNGDELNGRAWVDMGERERMIYLWGVREAMIAVNPRDYGKWLPRGSFQEIATEVDRFYSTVGARDVPLLDALRIIRDRQVSPAKK